MAVSFLGLADWGINNIMLVIWGIRILTPWVRYLISLVVEWFHSIPLLPFRRATISKSWPVAGSMAALANGVWMLIRSLMETG